MKKMSITGFPYLKILQLKSNYLLAVRSTQTIPSVSQKNSILLTGSVIKEAVSRQRSAVSKRKNKYAFDSK